MENFHGDNLSPHNINKLSCSHQSQPETQYLCLPELCLSSVQPEHQPSKIYESLTWKHIKNYNAGQVSHHPSLHDGNHHMRTFPLFIIYAWIGQGFHSVKEIPNHGHIISEVDWGAQHSCGKNIYDGGKNGEHSCGEILHGNSTKKHMETFHHPCSLDHNQHMDTSQTFSNYVKRTLNHGLSLM